jgi:hypothetical protein
MTGLSELPLQRIFFASYTLTLPNNSPPKSCTPLIFHQDFATSVSLRYAIDAK